MVYFVGAGPGAVDLITVRGKKLLEEADLIVYAGSLVNPALLDFARPGCVKKNSAHMTLEQVVEAMAPFARQGKTVVRLHTGDPSVFGAIREQMDALKSRGIPFRVVPGVSSFCGAAAALGAEYTLPGVSQTVILTRLAGRTPVPPRESIRSLSEHRSSMAVFLSAGMTGRLKEELLAGGYPADTPAAIVYKATWPDEKIVRGTVARLPEMTEQAGITKTALILVGGFLGEDYERSRLYDPSFSHGFREKSV